jgi:mannose-6-phosphate isomerase-like protein (cupin superfamily)
MKVVDVPAKLAAVAEGSFIDTVDFNGKSFGACDITGVSPVWEMHPDTDEYFHVLEGELELTLLTANTTEHHVARAGCSMVVPKGLWHKPAAPNGAKFIYFTPGQSLHSDADDPREASS